MLLLNILTRLVTVILYKLKNYWKKLLYYYLTLTSIFFIV